MLELPAADGTRGTIAVDSFSWGVHKAGAAATGGAWAVRRRPGKVSVQDLSLTKKNAAPAPAATEEPAARTRGRFDDRGLVPGRPWQPARPPQRSSMTVSRASTSPRKS